MVSSLMRSAKASLVAIAILTASVGAVAAVSSLTAFPAPTVLAGCDDYSDDGLGDC
jgi:hypothetical protein